MSTETYNLVTVILWAAAFLAGLGTVRIYYLQLEAMNAAIRAQNLAWLIQYLQAKDVRHARFIVMTELSNNNSLPGGWTPKQREAAGTACAAYGVAAVFIELKRVDKDVIVQNWGPSIREVCGVCENFIADRRRKSGDRYWGALVSLNDELARNDNQELARRLGTSTI